MGDRPMEQARMCGQDIVLFVFILKTLFFNRNREIRNKTGEK